MWAAKVGSGGQIPQGQRLDPLGTSMRNFGSPNVSHLLTLVEEGKSLPGRGGAGNQDEIDLRFVGLIRVDSGTPSLTPLGRTVLTEWRRHAVDDDAFGHELARHVILLVEAIRLNHRAYVAMVDFWLDVRQSYDVDALLKSRESLYLVSYLNQAVDGYNPWIVIKDSRAKLSADFENEWKKLESATAGCGAPARKGLSNVKDRIVGFATRGDPRVLFCAAMELLVRARSGEDVTGALNSWSLPLA